MHKVWTDWPPQSPSTLFPKPDPACVVGIQTLALDRLDGHGGTS